MCAGQVWELPVLTLQNVTENTQKHMKNPETDTKRPTRDARRTQSNTNHQRTAAQWHKTTIKWHKMTVKKHKTTSGKSNNLRMMQTTTDLGVLLLFGSTLVTLCLCFRHSRRIKAVSSLWQLVHVRGGSRARRLFSPESDSLMFRLLLREIACVVTRGWVNIDQ